MRKMNRLALLIGLMVLAISKSGSAQLTGVQLVPGNYPDLATAITDLNAQGVGAGGVLFNVLAPQSAPAGGYVITASGSAANPIGFFGNGNTITASAGHTVGALNDGIIKIIGGDFIGISGFVLQENPANTVTTPASNNMTEWGIAFLYASTTDGAQFNGVQGCTISLNRTYANTFGIYSNVRHSATAVGTTADITAVTGSNSGNRIYGNTISNVNMGIAFIGSGTAANMDIGNDIGGSAVSEGNTITNWGGSGAASTYISNTGTSYGIFMNHQTNMNVSYNTLTSASVTPTVTFRGIVQDFTVAAPSGTIGDTISFNTITMTSGQTSGTFRAIDAVSGGLGSTLFITNNTITGCAISGVGSSSLMGGIFNAGAKANVHITNNIIQGNTSTATTGGFTGISNTGAVGTLINISNNQLGNASGNAITFSAATSGAVSGILNTGAGTAAQLNITSNDLRSFVQSVAGTNTHTYISNTSGNANVNISNNTFTNMVMNSSGSLTFIGNNVTHIAGTTQNVNNNSIVGTFSKSVGGGTVLFYNSFSTSLTGVTEINTGNNFSNMTFTGATTINGWRCGDGSTTAPYGPGKTVTNNTFNNIVCGTNAATILEVDYSNSGSTSNNVSGNVITNISGGGNVTGLLSAQGNQNFFNNTIHTLSTSGAASLVMGISITGGSTQNILKNKLGNFSSDGATATCFGVRVSGGTTITLSNNTIGDLRAPNTTGANTVIGINLTGGTTHNVYNNTVHLNAISAGLDFGTSAISSVTTNALTMNNNLFVNTSTPNGTGLTVAYRRGNATLGTYGGTSNNNNFYVGTPDATHLVYYDGTTPVSTLAAYQALVTPRDAASIAVQPTFLSTTASAANFLHIDPSVPSLIESSGAPVAGITDDIDNEVRQGNGGYTGTGINPDLGADEFEQLIPPCTSVSAGTASAVATAICDGAAADLSTTGQTTGTAIISLQWKVAAVSGGPYTDVVGGTGATTTNYTSAALTPGTYYYVLEARCSYGGLVNNSNEVTVTVNSLPTVSFAVSPNDTLCEGTDLTLSGTGALSYSWDGGVTDNTPFPATVSATYNVTGTDVNGCTNTASVDIVVNTLPAVGFTATNDTICSGDPVTLSGSGAISYNWTGGVTDGVSFTPAVSTGYLLTGTDINGCSDTITAFITVNSLPAVSFTASPNDSICEGASLTLSGTGATSYSWDNGVSDGVSFAPLTSGDYVVTGTDGSECVNTDTVTVTVVVPPTVGYTASSETVCDGDPVTLSGTGAATYAWDNGVNDGVAFTPASTTTYTVTGTDAIGCSNTATVTVTVNPLPVVAYTISPNDTICPGEQITLSGTGASSYSWDGGVTNNVAFAPASSGTYTVTGTDGNGCSNTDAVDIVVLAAPTVNLGADISQPNPPAVLDAGSGFSGYLWSTNETTQTISVSNTGEYSVTVTNADGCSASDTIMVEFTNSLQEGAGLSAQVVVYPNPSHGLVNLSIDGLQASNVDLEVVDMTGRVVLTQSLGQITMAVTTSLDLQFAGEGTYLIRMTADGQTTQIPVVINR